MVRLGCLSRPGRFRDRPCCHVVAGSLVARFLAWVGVGHPFDRNDRMRLLGYSLVSTIAVWSDFGVRYWHLADIDAGAERVRSGG